MTRPITETPISVPGLAGCCAEAQADGVPCTSLGRACAECERAMTPKEPDPDPRAGEPADDENSEDPVDYWAV